MTTTSRMPAASAPSTTAKISSRARCPVASTSWWRAATSRTSWTAGSSAPPASTTATGSGCDPRLAQRDLELHPDRHRRARGEAVDLLHLVDRVDGRHPDGAGALAGGDLHRQRVDPADRLVEHDRADRADAGHGRVDGARALGGRGVVRLHLEAGDAQLQAAPREAHVIDDPRDEVRIDVHVHVVAATDQLAGALSGSRVGGHTRKLSNPACNRVLRHALLSKPQWAPGVWLPWFTPGTPTSRSGDYARRGNSRNAGRDGGESRSDAATRRPPA